MHDEFRVRPLARYDGASYLSLTHDDGSATDERSVTRRVAAIAMCALVGLFLAGCTPRSNGPASATPAQVVTVPVAVVATAPVVVVRQPLCDPGTLRCQDTHTVQVCRNGAWIAESCDQRCRERFGEHYLSQGCVSAASEPCRCVEDPDYGMLDGEAVDIGPDMIDGGPMEVDPGML